MDVAQWLRSLGLASYEQAFRDTAVDADTLPRLTGDDREELGVHTVGHRRKLLDANAQLELSPAPPVGLEAERRQLTVMPAAMPLSAAEPLFPAAQEPISFRRAGRTILM